MGKLSEIRKRPIDWAKTGYELSCLRTSNENLRRYVCSQLKYDDVDHLCRHDCAHCRYEMDRNISRQELAQVFACSETVIYNWEKGITPLSIEDLILYCEICRLSPKDLLVFE